MGVVQCNHVNKKDLSTYAAANLKRVPSVEPDATEYCSLTSSVNALHSRFNALVE